MSNSSPQPTEQSAIGAPKQNDASAEQSVAAESPLVDHLRELRDRLVKALLCVVLCFLVLFPFANDLYSFIAAPLIGQLPQGATMIATGVISPFFTPMKLSLLLALFVSVPLIIYQLWAFVAPALYRSEKKLVMPLAISSTLLFYIGAVFAYFVVFPLVFGFLAGTAPEGIEVAPDIVSYLDFVVVMVFAFGIAFEVPIATYIVVVTGVVSAEQLAAARPYLIVAAFVAGAFLTPPDFFSQILLALPMWMLFELGLLLAKRQQRLKNQNTE